MTIHLCDTNVWLALAISGHAHHERALRWFDAVSDASSVAFCRATQQSFLRLMTNAAVLGPYGNAPLDSDEAWAAYEALLADDRIVLRDRESNGIEGRWKQLAIHAEPSPKLWMDAYLAAFAFAADYTLVTNDRAFDQFAGRDLQLL